MPNRMLRDWTDSDKVNSLSVHSERFFVRLIMKVDDYGCFHADTRLLKAHLFPMLLDSIREADLLRWMAECQKAGLIVLYEVASKKYLRINDFKQRLDKSNSKYPLPPVNDFPPPVNDFPNEVEVEKKKKLEVEVEVEVENAPPKILVEFPFGEKFKTFWQEWKNYKKTEHRFNYKSPQSEQSSLKDLMEKSGGVEETAIKMIQQAMASGWKGFYELKISNNGKTFGSNQQKPTTDDLQAAHARRYPVRE